MLNARPEVVRDESQIIAQAGLPGMVTVATRMAGRGTDILLGGNPKGLVESTLYRNILDKCIPDLKHPSALPIPDIDLSSHGMTRAPPSVKGLMMSALARSHSTEDIIATSEDAEKLMTRVMSMAENLRSDVLLQLRLVGMVDDILLIVNL